MTQPAKHTPGPWSLCNWMVGNNTPTGEVTICGPEGDEHICTMDGNENNQANGNLIAAAPSLKNGLEDSDALLAELYQYVSTDLQASIVEQRRRNNDLLDTIEGVSA